MGEVTPISEETRAEIRERLGRGEGRNFIASAVGVSGDTVSRIAREIGHSFGEMAEKTFTGVRTRQTALAQRRVELSEQAHEATLQAVTYLLARLKGRADDPRGIEQAARAYRDTTAGYKDLVSIDGPTALAEDGVRDGLLGLSRLMELAATPGGYQSPYAELEASRVGAEAADEPEPEPDAQRPWLEPGEVEDYELEIYPSPASDTPRKVPMRRNLDTGQSWKLWHEEADDARPE